MPPTLFHKIYIWACTDKKAHRIPFVVSGMMMFVGCWACCCCKAHFIDSSNPSNDSKDLIKAGVLNAKEKKH